MDEQDISQSSPISPPPTGLTEEDALEQIRAQRDEYLQGWQRARADYENMQKNSAQIREDDRKRVRVHLAEDLLAVVDNFGYVTKHIPNTKDCPAEFQKQFSAWSEGIMHIERQFAETLKNMGVEPIEAIGNPFDTSLHEAGGTKQVEGVSEGIVVEELIRGWKMGSTVLRPSKVIVSA